MTPVESVLNSLGIQIDRQRAGRAWCLCVYHADHAPTNFFVRLRGSRAGQCWCFSCKQGGTLLDLVMFVRGCDLDSARAYVELLGKGYQPPSRHYRYIERRNVVGRPRFQMPSEIVFDPLESWIAPPRRYLESRKITPEEVDRYGLGYAVDGRLAGRIIVPWRGKDGRPYGYSARSFVGEEPKYTTPPSADKPDAGVMFGEHTWTDRRDTIVVTEGAFNAMAVARALSDQRVDIAAIGGSDVNPVHVIKLATFPRVILLTDPDPAGDKAARGLDSSLGRYVRTKRVRLPEGTDAQDVAQDHLRTVLMKAIEGTGKEDPHRVKSI